MFAISSQPAVSCGNVYCVKHWLCCQMSVKYRPHAFPACASALKIVGRSYCSTALSWRLASRPADVPTSEYARFGFVCVGTDENHASLIAPCHAIDERFGICDGWNIQRMSMPPYASVVSIVQ